MVLCQWGWGRSQDEDVDVTVMLHHCHSQSLARKQREDRALHPPDVHAHLSKVVLRVSKESRGVGHSSLESDTIYLGRRLDENTCNKEH